MPTGGSVTVAPYFVSGQLNLNAVPTGTSIFWMNPDGGDWNTAANWSTGVIPVSTDNAYINTSSAVTITYNDTGVTDTVDQLTSDESLNISAGTLVINGAATINGTLTLDGGELDANGTVTASSFTFTSGTLAGSSGLDTGGFSIGSGGVKTIDTPVANTGT